MTKKIGPHAADSQSLPPERSFVDAPAFPVLPPRPQPRRKFAKYFERGLWTIAAGCALFLTWAFGDRAFFTARENSRFEAALQAPAALSAPEPAKGPERAFMARLEIPSVSLSSLVVDGVDDATLRRAVGRIPQSARPGEPGNIALAGHRDTDFRPLKGLRRGERLTLRTFEGEYTYEVEWIRIVKPEQTEVLADSSYPTLTLVTCYPFNYVGRAPERYIVRAREIARPEIQIARM